MTTLAAYAAFLAARWDEQEDAAKRAAFGWGAEWRDETDDGEEWSVVHADGKRDMVGCEDGDVTRHIALHDPRATLDDLAAKRAILALHRIGYDPCDAHDGVTMKSVECDTVILLAEPFRDHPDHPANQGGQ